LKHDNESAAGGPEEKARRYPHPPLGEPSATMTPQGTALPGNAVESKASVGVVRGLVEAIERAEVERERFAAAAGLRLDELGGAEARVSVAELQRLCALAVELSDDPLLGLHWAGWLTERMFVPVSHLIAHSKSLRQGFELLAQYLPLLCDHVAYRIFEGEDEVVLQRLPLPDESPLFRQFSSEIMVGGFGG
jgi:hypothetical protein